MRTENGFASTLPAGLSGTSAPLLGKAMMTEDRVIAPGRSDPRRVLVIEDNPDSRESLRILLQIWGHEVEVAGNGLDGVRKALSWEPEVAVVDIGLPGLDGYQVARKVRAALGGRIRLIALTAYNTLEDVRSAHQAGFDVHLGKPADPEELSRWVRMA
jgi:CheY-like chemotaxis protein